VILSSSTFSDELEAIHLTHQESIEEKNRNGQVIQHRAWKTVEAFRSDQDRLQGS
jgi:chromosome transmission fidelity protein 18